MRIMIKFTGITEKNHRPRRASHPRRISGLDLMALLFAVSTSPRNVILINQVWNFLVSTNDIIGHMGPFHSPLQLQRGRRPAV